MALKVEFIAQNGELVRPGARKSLWIMALSVLAGLSVGLAAKAGNFLIVDAPSRSDAILVLAGETDRRPQRALELLSQGYGRRVVLDVPRTQNLRVYSNRISTEVHRRSAYASPSQHLPDPWTVNQRRIQGGGKMFRARGSEKRLDCDFGFSHPAGPGSFPAGIPGT